MADDLEVIQSAPSEPEEEGGGPVKTFLEHLEDLRWTLIKVAVSIFLGFIVCLSAAPQIIEFLTWPLKRAERVRLHNEPDVVISLGTNVFHRARAIDFPVTGLSTNTNSYFKLMPVKVEPGQVPSLAGGGFLMAMAVDTNPPPAALNSIAVSLQILGPMDGFMLMKKQHP